MTTARQATSSYALFLKLLFAIGQENKELIVKLT